jgi:hypothetical protein
MQFHMRNEGRVVEAGESLQLMCTLSRLMSTKAESVVFLLAAFEFF